MYKLELGFSIFLDPDSGFIRFRIRNLVQIHDNPNDCMFTDLNADVNQMKDLQMQTLVQHV
jgi:hypothetical protein